MGLSSISGKETSTVESTDSEESELRCKVSGNCALKGHCSKYGSANSNNFVTNSEEQKMKLRCVINKQTC
jgi:dihydroxyacid dehydratase/phosphogluconate dehydratase